MLLTIDTSVGTAVAVVDPDSGTILAERSTDDTRRHAEVLGPFLVEVLDEAGLAPADVTGVVSGMGPGPFTGLRVGIAGARTFAMARKVPFLPLVSHDALAAEAFADASVDMAPGGAAALVVLTDARRREVYWSAYRVEGGAVVRTAGPGLAKPADLDVALGVHAESPRRTATAIPAGRLGLVAAERLRIGAPFAEDAPLYLRDPDVTMPGVPKRVRA